MTTQNKKTKKKLVVDLTRGDVLKMAAAAAGAIVAAPLLTTGPLSPFGQLKQGQLEGEGHVGHGAQTGQYHWGMVINLDQCIGCEYCMRACTATNDVNPEEPWNIVISDKTSDGTSFFLSRPCLHCQNAPCVEVCPVKATYHREDGLVVMDYDRCIGCRYCEVACPYAARHFNWKTRDEDDNPYVPAWGELKWSAVREALLRSAHSVSNVLMLVLNRDSRLAWTAKRPLPASTSVRWEHARLEI